MPSILVIAYYFPPKGMGGVQRPVKFARYLYEFGWDVTVITGAEDRYHSNDASLLEELPTGVHIERVPYVDIAMRVGIPAGQPSWHRKYAKLLDWPDRHRGFAMQAVARARELMKVKKFDVLLTTSPPPSVHLAGLALRREIAWIADFRDPWQAGREDYGPTFIHRLYNRALHRRIVKGANAVVAVTPELAQLYHDMVPSASCTVIRNGFDDADFSSEGEVTPETAVNVVTREDRQLTINFPGTFSVFSDPTPLIQGLAMWRKSHPGRTLHLRHLGLALGIDLHESLRKFDLSAKFEENGYFDHAKYIEILHECDIIAIAYANDAVTDLSVPGRIYEALRTLLPLLVLTPKNGALANLLSSVPGCAVVEPDNIADIPAAIDKLSAFPRQTRKGEDIAPFERKAQARQLAELALSVIANRQSAPR